MPVNEMEVRGRGFSEYTRLERAREIIFSKIEELESEELSFQKADGRVISRNVESEVNVPPFDRAAMDGYAVRAEDTFGVSENNPKKLEVIGSIEIGLYSDLEVGEGKAAKISTGAPIPKGADAVIKLEETEIEDSKLEIFAPVSVGENVSKKGEDVESGTTVFEAPRRLRPSDLGLLASTGNLEVEVKKKPMVGIAITGNELREPGDKLEPGEIIETNSSTLGASVERCGGKYTRLGIVPDEIEEIEDTLEKASDFDLLILTGGSSVGEKDYVPEVISNRGELILHGVAMRPGSPSSFGMVKETPVFSLAGSPAAALVAFEMLIRPTMRVMQGLPPEVSELDRRAKLSRKISSSLGRLDVVRVKLSREGNEYYAEPIRITGSSILRTVSEADGIVLVPEDIEGFRRGEVVEVRTFDL